jgi:ATP-dependent Clp protease adaptor protein ClpS
MVKERTSSGEQSREDIGSERLLILYNDDHNSFEHVIQALVEVCGHDEIQAEQCAVVAHFKGKCDISRGNIGVLAGMQASLQNRDLIVEIV